jgi:hypothetical protein
MIPVLDVLFNVHLERRTHHGLEKELLVDDSIGIVVRR